MLFASLMRSFTHTLFPADCVLCRGHAPKEQPFCQTCLKSLPSLPHCCIQCARFLPGFDKIELPQCHFCRIEPPPYARTFALFPYQYPIVEMIVQLKFHHRLEQAHALGLLLAAALPTWYRNQRLPDLLIPVPLHPLRLKERGFNQAIEIARPVSKHHGIKLDCWGVQRIHHTAPQSALDASDRQQNLLNAFGTQQAYQGKTIAVLDDVVTTGQTVQSLCGLLKEKGARRIDIWCCARRG